ncbi:MAG: DUF294 nucleotidyltransferase-like domain-containing protein, partial [Acidimicrobiales bacterium]
MEEEGPWPKGLLARERDRLALEVLEGRLAPGHFSGCLSEVADRFLEHLLREALKTCGAGSHSSAGYALVAVGGYGRGELAPRSDLDVLLLHEKRRRVQQLAESIWYAVWDSGLRLDHSVRTPKEVASVATSDLRAMLGLLDGRLVAGDRELAENTLQSVAEIWRAHHPRLLPELGSAGHERRRRFGDLPFLLEPNLKESSGGLRDLEMLALAARALPKLAGFIRPPELDSAKELLASTRVVLHARTGNDGDRLALQEQDEVAAVLGYADADALMAALAEAGREVMWASGDGWLRIHSALLGPAGRGGGREMALGHGVVLRDGEIALAGDADVRGDPTLLLRLATAAAERRLPIAASAFERLEARRSERPELPEPW